MSAPIREIPYNYTSFSDREIVARFLGDGLWEVIDRLRGSRRTGHSARLMFEVLGDMWVITRNPYIQDDLQENPRRWRALIRALYQRLDQVVARAGGNELALRLHDAVREAVRRFEAWLPAQRKRRRQAHNRLARATRRDNIDFSGYARIAHVTDATDWRVEMPFVVISPDTEQEVQAVVEACIELGLTVIARGGGTGYTGGAVPLYEDSAVINTEKLEGLGDIEVREIGRDRRSVPTVRAEAGVVTRRVSDLAQARGLVFAVDPTSQDASTIGGNIAMNAGGKKAVLWGTTVDNLLSWRMVTPDAQWLEIERLDHNLGKIHETEYAEFRVTRYDRHGKRAIAEPEILRLPGRLFRRHGLGKDVTNKFLGGLPGVQKEGCDGLITSAVFVLHRMPVHGRTLCLEFFGADLRPAVSAIVAIKSFIEGAEGVSLAGMEHLDERYLRAVGYTTKAPRAGLPRMLLLIDVAGDDADRVAEVASGVVRIANRCDGEGFIAVSPEARRRFWEDRGRTAAIAAHTNAFKINEDVVIPLDRLAEYTAGIERINIEQSLANKLRIVAATRDFLRDEAPRIRIAGEFGSCEEDDALLRSKCAQAQALADEVAARWRQVLAQLDMPVETCAALFSHAPTIAPRPGDRLVDLLLRREWRISWRRELERPLKEIFGGRDFEPLHRRLDEIHAAIRSSRLFVALHMHAGDGNVHTNIPVNSNDYAMLHEAERIVDRVMALAGELGGVISGEHGIGITKLRYLDRASLDDFAGYKQRVDPEGRFNRGKLLAGAGLERAYTPSLRLVQQEALILEDSALGALNDDIRHCLRCGKCKPVCTTHVPRANLLYSPRNKILATGLIIEAFLYEEQTRRGISLRHFDEMNDVADHCTVCHRCLAPCPVDIDFGDVSIRMRTILRERAGKKPNFGTRLSLAFLNVTRPGTIRLMRKGMIEWGFRAQRAGHSLLRMLAPARRVQRPAATTGAVRVPAQIVHFFNKPLPGGLPTRTTRALLGLEDQRVIPILRDPLKAGENSDAVFYFPGCGSERLFSQIGLATLAMLYETGAQTVLPPGYLCCGYPQTSSGDEARGRRITTDNRVLFHRMAQNLSYLDIRTVIVSCGTCMDQLLKYEFEKIFPGCRLLDIHEYLMEKGVRLEGVKGVQYLYHDPCHTPMKTYAPLKVASELMGQAVGLSDRCCGEAGTFAVARPDIATQVRFRKEEELRNGIEALTGATEVRSGEVKLLTSCPACQQGLSRYREDTGLDTDYIVVEIAKHRLGDGWQQRFIEQAQRGGIERVLL